MIRQNDGSRSAPGQSVHVLLEQTVKVLVLWSEALYRLHKQRKRCKVTHELASGAPT